MYKLLVCSDSHGKREKIEDAFIAEKPNGILHLGDGADEGEFIAEEYFSVRGNCDRISTIPLSLIREFESVCIFATHGNIYNVKSSRDLLALKAKDEGAILACYGHTHNALLEEIEGISVLNPGCIKDNSYAVVLFDTETFEIKFKELK